MKPLIRGLLALAPFAILLVLWQRPAWDLSLSIPIGHFYIVTFTTFTALVLSILLSSALNERDHPHHVLAALAFAVMGGIFFTHGLATPGALIAHFHPAISWSAWLTLFSGGGLFLLAGLMHSPYRPTWLQVRPVVYLTVLLVGAYLLVAAFAPAWLTAMDEDVGPWHRQAVFLLTLLLWGLAALLLFQGWRRAGTHVEGVLTLVAFWMVAATISMHRFPVWNLSWWLYHFLLLLTFLLVFVVLVQRHEQARRFRLIPYYLGFALIFTAFLTLLASAIFSYQIRQQQLAQSQGATQARLATLIEGALAPLPAEAAAATRRDAVIDALEADGSFGSFIVYSEAGRVSYTNDPTYPPNVAELFAEGVTGALAGEPTTMTMSPEAVPRSSGYSRYGGEAEAEVDPEALLLLTFLPLPGGAGVVQVADAVTGLEESALRARGSGLAISALLMTLLFLALFLVVRRANQIIVVRTEELEHARRQSDTLLRNILPDEIAEELKESGRVQPVDYDSVTVMFTDFKDFTRISSTMTPQELVEELDYYFTNFDRITRHYGLEKLKTIGDSYMCAGGIPQPMEDHAQRVVQAACELQAFMAARQAKQQAAHRSTWDIRIGIHSGPLVAGVIGQEKFAYDVWGDTVNIASRMEGAGEPGRINISSATYQLIRDAFECEPRGEVTAKNGERFEMYYVVGPREG